MPVPIVCPVFLAPEEHARLESLVRAHSTPQAFAFRCRLILRAAAPDRPSGSVLSGDDAKTSVHCFENRDLWTYVRSISPLLEHHPAKIRQMLERLVQASRCWQSAATKSSRLHRVAGQ